MLVEGRAKENQHHTKGPGIDEYRGLPDQSMAKSEGWWRWIDQCQFYRGYVLHAEAGQASFADATVAIMPPACYGKRGGGEKS